MFRGAKNANGLNIFKWRRRGESSLTTGLLDDVQHEIELSDYRRAPSPGSESPSGLLNGESLNVEPIADLDLFFERLYSYYCEKGLWCIIIKWIVELLSLAFTICFSGFVLLYVDWNGLRNAKCGMDAVESGIKPCDLSEEALHQHPLVPFTLSKAIIVGYLGIFSIYWIFCFLRFFAQLKDILKIRQFYYNSLCVTDNEIQTMPWASILEKVVQLQSSQQLCVVKDLSAHDIVMRLMRKENYLIGMLNKGVLAFPISQWVPGAGPTVKFGPNGSRYRLILTKTLEWTLNWCILQSMFDRNFCVRRDFISNPKTLKKRLMVVGLAMLLLSPFLVIFMLVYLFLRHAEQFYNHPSTASSRRWSNLSKWIFREFNEVDHFFKHRINSSILHASDYLKQFPSPIITIVAKFISFVSGGFAAILIIIAFLEESLLEGHIFGRNLFWYAAVFGTITAITRAAVSDELLVLDPQGSMSLVVQHTHHMPKRWRGKENTVTVRTEFETLFQYTGMMLLEEMASIFLTPYLLLFVVPKRVDDILQFIADFTVNVEGVGHVCSFSVFDFQNHGNSNYGAPYSSPSIQRSSQGKMEKSFLSFQSSYPTWDPNAQGKQFLSTLQKFRDQMLQGLGTRPPGTQHQWTPNFRGLGDRNSFLAREMPQNIPGIGYQLGSMWMIDADQKNCPYIIDWYYTSRPRHATDNSRNVPRGPFDSAEEGSRDFWVPPPHLPQNEATYEENWSHLFQDRSRSHLEASTSAPLLCESVLQHHDSSSVAHPTKSRWWARSRPHGADPQTSFLEPPNFNHNIPNNYYDHFSDRSLEEEEQHFDWRSSHGLSRTYYMNNLEEGEFNLPFDDIYSRPPESPSMNFDPTSSV
ncbi:autophagy-related protein 9 isoform X1 [Actinidia eriantha]|uniref:autophagy-related protein 9 isoform X1 n=1 Tax=Actinidia eriantha TaxID=165200 RepID=UPI0025854DBC|nr:autophagy-related protein 9 isoform X1 [Actinidia eriantha]XP_057513287.1 autophagy-related protein 9 isoform X1 [Actinidia eriantha]XP_057513290.1 autophagy-related protein 9 isoform X1 [Actinidia eriantha]XP_057513291.1 autophagy-related protein 9 isoform X1 [Actinidia eriantha]